MSIFPLATFSILVVATAAEKGCNDRNFWMTGISCCEEGFTIGDNENDFEEFIQPNEYDTSCWKSCQKLYPHYRGMTESLKQTYSSGPGKGQKKCWCELKEDWVSEHYYLNENNKDYQTCSFMEEQQKEACTSYIPLTDAWRRIDTTSTTKERNCDYDSTGKEVDSAIIVDSVIGSGTDHDDQRWYRFMGPAGSKLPEGPSNGTRNCGSTYSAYIYAHEEYLKNSPLHPTIRDGIVNRFVCFESSSTFDSEIDSCFLEPFGRSFHLNLISIAACLEGGEEYFVYEIPPFDDWDFQELDCAGYCSVE